MVISLYFVMTRKFYLYLATSLLVTTLSSQNYINGVVLDKRTSLPLEGATIACDTYKLGGTSDASGNFTIEYSDTIKCNFIISFVGYEETAVTLAPSNRSYTIYLQPDATFETINITAKKKKYDTKRI